MIYTLSKPFVIGDLAHQITIDNLEIASIAINFEPFYSDKGKAVVSIVLVHRASGWKQNIVYSDAEGANALAFWKLIDGPNSVVQSATFNKLIADGKLPAGTLS